MLPEKAAFLSMWPLSPNLRKQTTALGWRNSRQPWICLLKMQLSRHKQQHTERTTSFVSFWGFFEKQWHVFTKDSWGNLEFQEAFWSLQCFFKCFFFLSLQLNLRSWEATGGGDRSVHTISIAIRTLNPGVSFRPSIHRITHRTPTASTSSTAWRTSVLKSRSRTYSWRILTAGTNELFLLSSDIRQVVALSRAPLGFHQHCEDPMPRSDQQTRTQENTKFHQSTLLSLSVCRN